MSHNFLEISKNTIKSRKYKIVDNLTKFVDKCLLQKKVIQRKKTKNIIFLKKS